jgi:two-component system, NarL family, sensor histidine kinase UhpB
MIDATAEPAEAPGSEQRPFLGRLSLTWRVFLSNTVVLLAAVLTLALTPARITVPSTWPDAVVLVAGLAALLLTNLVVMRRAYAPLRRLTELMRRVEPLEPGRRIPVYGDDAEVVELTRAFNAMLDRLEAERSESARRSLAAQEGERRRVAQELHDEVGQALTAIVLQLERASRLADGPLRAELTDARESARASLEDVRGIAQRLRPEALEDLGLASALKTLCDRLADRSGLSTRVLIERELPGLTPEAELVIYRVTQEALTNTLRHAHASEAVVELDRDAGQLLLRVADNGRGRNGASPGTGIQGMRERALLVGGRLHIGETAGGGTEVRLRLPIQPRQ